MKLFIFLLCDFNYILISTKKQSNDEIDCLKTHALHSKIQIPSKLIFFKKQKECVCFVLY
jgi:hypothetical protein